MTLRVGSTFSGIGGIDLGFERAGMEVKWQVEIDKHACEILRHHWPEVQIYDDIRAVHATDPQPEQRGEGRRVAVEATGSSLDGGHGLGEPDSSSSHGRPNEANALGPIDVLVGGFPCQDLSLAGKRAGLAGEKSGLWHEFRRLVAECRPRWVVVENVPGLLSSNGGADMAVVLRGLEKLGYGWAFRVLDAQHFGVAQRRRRVFIVGHLGAPWSAATEVLFESESCSGNPPSRKKPGQDTAAGTVQSVALRGREGGGTGAQQVSDTSNRQVGITHGATVRRLTPRECERLQGFPDDWTFGADAKRYFRLGNAVCVSVAEWIGRRIVAVDAK